MGAAIFLGFLLATIAVVRAAMVAFSKRTAKWLRVLWIVCFLTAAIAAYFTTFHCVYYANENTRFHGWLVPTVIFQRASPTSPWLDFIGPVTFLAYPMNVLLFSLIPSLGTLISARRSCSQDTEELH